MTGDAARIPEIHPPGPPDSVLHAVMVMYACAVACVVRVIIYVLTLGAPKAVIGGKHSLGFASRAGTPPHAVLLAVVIATLITAGLLAWLAPSCESGANWARVAGTVTCVIGALGAIYDIGLSPEVAARVFSCVDCAKGLAVVVLLWLGSSNEYFRSVRRRRCTAGRP
jgi:hypothetical protein